MWTQPWSCSKSAVTKCLKRRQIQDIEERMITIENELDTVTADYEKEQQDLMSLENKVALLEKHARDTREVGVCFTDFFH